MRQPSIVFVHQGLTIHAGPCGEAWCGEILDERGEVLDLFAYTRDGYPGAVIGALTFPELSFATALAARLWLHTGDALEQHAGDVLEASARAPQPCGAHELLAS